MIAAGLGFVWAHASLGILVGSTTPQLGGAVKLARDGRSVRVVGSLRNRSSRFLVAQVQISFSPSGATQAWNERVLEGPAEQVKVLPGQRWTGAWTIELDLPAGRYEAWLWMRTPSGSGWVGSAQERVTRTPLRMERTAALLRSKPPGGVALRNVVAQPSEADPSTIVLSGGVDNQSGAVSAIAIRWGLVPAAPADVTAWARRALVPSGGIRWLTAPPGLTELNISGASLMPAGEYDVRVQVVAAPAPLDPSDAGTATALVAAPLDDVLVTGTIGVTPVVTTGIVRIAPPAGPLAVTEVASGAAFVEGRSAAVTMTITNLSDRDASGSVFAILGPVGSQ